MTTFEQELRKLLDKTTAFSDARFVGNTCYGRLNEDVRVKIKFATGGISSQYDRLKVTLLNRREGEIDNLFLRFQDIWGIKQTGNPNFREGVSPHIWDDKGKVGWYVYQPTKTDYRQLSEAVNSYLDVFQEPVQSQQIGQKMC
jgi:hypothetical protein